MKKGFDPRQLDAKAFARAATPLTATQSLAAFPRLAAEVHGAAEGLQVNWTAEGELRPGAEGQDQVWLHVQARAHLPLMCQRCMTRMEQDVQSNRWFRFAADEASAAVLDEEVEEDVLALDVPLDLLELVEDELLMSLPLVPRHETCPSEVKLEAKDDAFDDASEAKPHPFAALASLRLDKPH